MTLILLVSLFAYFLGSIPFGLILSKKILNIDIRKLGSKNIGATNVIRAGNRKIGALTLLLDISKVIIPMMMAKYFDIDAKMIIIIGFFSLLGHVFPIWLNFRGGKGVAAYFGILLIMSPLFSLLFILMWVSTFVTTRYSSLSSITSIISIPVVYIMVNMMKLNDFIYYDFLSPKDIDFRINFTIILFMSVILIYRHMENIKRLIKGQESKLK
mgnify:FL=1